MYLTRATHKAIKIACTYFHYAHSVPAVSYGYNVYNENKEWCGCVCFGTGATINISKPFGLPMKQVYELVRVALNGKQEYTSQAVALSLKQLHKDNPEIKIVVSYADMGQNHLGIIYQATNWLYVGVSEGTSGHLLTWNDKNIHYRSITSVVKRTGNKKIYSLFERTRTTDKFKYIYVFDKKLRKEWQKKSLPYPKKTGSD